MEENVSVKKKNWKVIVIAIIAIIVVAATVIGISAYLTDMQTLDNIFTMGNVRIRLDEGAWEETLANGENLNITPNAKIAKEPKIVNEGKNDAYVFLKVKIPTGKISPNDTTESPLFKYTKNSGWELIETVTNTDEHYVEKVYCYTDNNGILKGKNGNTTYETGTLFDYIIFENIKGNFEQNTVQFVDISAYAIQSDNIDVTGSTVVEKASAAYTKYLAQDEEIKEAARQKSLYTKMETANYGDYVDLGTNILDQESTQKDWRIFYKDTNKNQVYLILADYLPNENGISQNMGIETNNDMYTVKASTGSRDFIQKLNDREWKSELLPETLLAEYPEISAKGAIDIENFANSWNDLYPSKHLYVQKINEQGYAIGTKATLSAYDTILMTLFVNSQAANNTLYFAHPGVSEVEGCYGYWFASPSANTGLDGMYNAGEDISLIATLSPNAPTCGLRPIVILPDTVIADKIGDNLWQVK